MVGHFLSLFIVEKELYFRLLLKVHVKDTREEKKTDRKMMANKWHYTL